MLSKLAAVADSLAGLVAVASALVTITSHDVADHTPRANALIAVGRDVADPRCDSFRRLSEYGAHWSACTIDL
jgi:hypothetical protein